jgi:hypothetical protein
MNCRAVQDELMLGFGIGRLSDEAEGHVARCAACRELQLSLQSLAGKMGSDQAFYPDEVEVERLMARMEDTLDSTRSRREPAAHPFFARNLLRYAAVLAVPVIAAGLYLAGYMPFREGDQTMVAVQSETAGVWGDSAGVYEVSDAAAEALLYEYSARNQFTAGDELLDDLTAEELEYLKRNFDVGELLL